MSLANPVARPLGILLLFFALVDPHEVRFGSKIGHTAYNGATRQIPGTSSFDSRNGHPIPTEDEEPLWMKMSVTQPCPAGSAMIRDDR